MFWFKKKQFPIPKPAREVKENRLSVTTTDRDVISWSIDKWEGHDKLEPWRDFYKWFFGRTGDVFIIHYKDGETMIRREDIRRFSVHIYTKKVDA